MTHAFSDGDGSLQVAALKVAAVKELANDVTVSGEMEPAAYVTETVRGGWNDGGVSADDAPFRLRRG